MMPSITGQAAGHTLNPGDARDEALPVIGPLCDSFS